MRQKYRAAVQHVKKRNTGHSVIPGVFKYTRDLFLCQIHKRKQYIRAAFNRILCRQENFVRSGHVLCKTEAVNTFPVVAEKKKILHPLHQLSVCAGQRKTRRHAFAVYGKFRICNLRIREPEMTGVYTRILKRAA